MNNKYRNKKELNNYIRSRSLFFFIFYLVSFFIATIILYSKEISIAYAQGVLLNSTIAIIMFIPFMDKMNKYLILFIFVFFIVYPLFNYYLLFNVVMIIYCFIAIISITRFIIKYVL